MTTHRVPMYSDNGTEVQVTEDKVERMESLGWSKDKPVQKKAISKEKDQPKDKDSKEASS